MIKRKTLSLTPYHTEVNGMELPQVHGGLNGLYKALVGDYPKFYKMDALCKTGFLGAHILFEGCEETVRENCAIVLFNRQGSLVTDRHYQDTIRDSDNYFPSPAIFVYTLANIVTGEIAIRHKCHGETAFYIMDNRDVDTEQAIVADLVNDTRPRAVLYGWVEGYDNDNYEASLTLDIYRQ